jgi:hypothetical protein
MYEPAFESEDRQDEGMQRRNAAGRSTAKRLTFAEHVDGLIARERSPGTPKGPEMLAGFDPPLDGPVVLFDQIIEVTAHPMPAISVQSPAGFELSDRRRVSAVAVRMDHARRGVVLSAQGL